MSNIGVTTLVKEPIFYSLTAYLDHRMNLGKWHAFLGAITTLGAIIRGDLSFELALRDRIGSVLAVLVFGYHVLDQSFLGALALVSNRLIVALMLGCSASVKGSTSGVLLFDTVTRLSDVLLQLCL